MGTVGTKGIQYRNERAEEEQGKQIANGDITRSKDSQIVILQSDALASQQVDKSAEPHGRREAKGGDSSEFNISQTPRSTCAHNTHISATSQSCAKDQHADPPSPPVHAPEPTLSRDVNIFFFEDRDNVSAHQLFRKSRVSHEAVHHA